MKFMELRDLWMPCSVGYWSVAYCNLVTIAASTLVTFFWEVKVPRVTKLLTETHGKLDLAPKFTIWQIKRTTCTPISGTAAAIRGSAAAANHVCIPAIKLTAGVRANYLQLKWCNIYLLEWKHFIRLNRKFREFCHKFKSEMKISNVLWNRQRIALGLLLLHRNLKFPRLSSSCLQGFTKFSYF